MKQIKPKVKSKKEESEFGKGLTYCLGLFLAHERDRYVFGKDPREISEHDSKMWFNSSSDHLYEIETPEFLPKKLKIRIKEFKDKVISWGHGFGNYPYGEPSQGMVWWSLREAKELLKLIDESFGIKTVEATWK